MNKHHHLDPSPEGMTKRVHKAVLRLLLLLTLTTTSALPIAQAAEPIPTEAYGDAGTLTYTGFIRGSITFHSSECAHLNNALAMELPYQPRYPEHTARQPPTPGPHMIITALPAQVVLALDNRHKTPTNTFLGSFLGTEQPGPRLTWGDKGGKWYFTFHNYKLWSNDPMAKSDETITLNGTVTCLYDVKGREKPITPLP
jgi:hypothetical protein